MREGGEGWLVKRVRRYMISGGDAGSELREEDELIGNSESRKPRCY